MKPFKHSISTVEELSNGYCINGVTLVQGTDFYIWEVETDNEINITKSSSKPKEIGFIDDLQIFLKKDKNQIISRYYQLLKEVLDEQRKKEDK